MPTPHSHDGFEETIYGLEGVSTSTTAGEVDCEAGAAPSQLDGSGRLSRVVPTESQRRSGSADVQVAPALCVKQAALRKEDRKTSRLGSAGFRPLFDRVEPPQNPRHTLRHHQLAERSPVAFGDGIDPDVSYLR